MSSVSSHASIPAPRPPPAPNLQGNTNDKPSYALRIKEAAFSLLDASDAISRLGALQSSEWNSATRPLATILALLQERFARAYGKPGQIPPMDPNEATDHNQPIRDLLSAYDARKRDAQAAAFLAAQIPPQPAPAPSALEPASTRTLTAARPTRAAGQRPARSNPVPAPKAASKAVPFSYANAAKAGLSSLVSQLAVAFPTESPAGLVTMAQSLAPKPVANKPHVRHAPRHSSRHIDIMFVGETAPLAESVPLDGFVYRDLLDHLGNSMVEDQPRLASVAWNHRGRFRLTFDGVVPSSLDATITQFFGTKYARDKQATSVRIERFSFKNQVVFRRVPALYGPDIHYTSESLLRELKSDPVWSNVEITRPPNFYLPKPSDKRGMFFVEFNDNATSRTLKRVTSSPIYLNGELCFAVKTYDSQPPAPQCAICLRWGHRTHLCRSPSKRCWKCGGNHDERDHAKTCGPCQKAGNVTGHCPCLPSCVNCHGAHKADSHDCSFYAHRRDRDWLAHHMLRDSPAGKSTERGSKRGSGGKKGKGKGREREVTMEVEED